MRYSILGVTVQQITSIGGTDIKETKAVGVIFATLTDEQVERLKVQGASLSQVGSVKAHIMPPTPIAAIPTYTAEDLILLMNFDAVRGMTDPPLYGSGVNVAVIGTGIRETHQKINGRVIWRKNYTTDVMQDGFNHDTGTTSLLVTMAPLCNVLNMKVLDSKGNGTEEEVVLAIDDCISMQDTDPNIAPIVISMSLGGPDDANPSNPLRVACRAAAAKGIYIFASAGNSGPGPYSVTCPACERYVFAIGSVGYIPENQSFIISSFSSRGPTLEGLVKPDAVLFGESISMASSESDTATVAKSGTSFATPIAAAMGVVYHEGVVRQAVWKQAVLGAPAAALYYVSPSEIIDSWLPRISLKPVGSSTGKDNSYGWGVPYGPLVVKSLSAAPAMDISTVMASVSPIFAIAVLGMIMGQFTKVSK